ncbi:F0F1 ATP synthase subunit epsilon [Aureimonas fodinaquatilis]|uniref:ATP synthase epsilon chain n=1 Tax=Aureimonas fodinaquatilis TaxID=2565783 RepID=A0A5B0DVC5_9HYPH|nr:F0F1 ATP synthase subunit epsilon [Aureimonas fodinaquatilis]KAA0969751.1 F0F1 ATP synthase subunit epsilon [Aureimonas fodinaquatilis]
MADSFKFELVSPERLLLSEQVTAVIAPGSEGYFTVMARHAPLVVTLKPGVVHATLASGGERRIFIRGGFADMNPDGFTLLAEYAVAVEDLSAAELDQQIRNTEEDVADANDADARSRAEMRLADLHNARAALNL